MAKDSSPFHQTKFVPIENVYSAEGTLFGLRSKKDGSIIINFNQSTAYSQLVVIARLTNCEIVQVHGTWTFLPHRNVRINDEEVECHGVPNNKSTDE